MFSWDKTVRKAVQNWLSDVVRHPRRLFDPIRVQTIGIIRVTYSRTARRTCAMAVPI